LINQQIEDNLPIFAWFLCVLVAISTAAPHDASLARRRMKMIETRANRSQGTPNSPYSPYSTHSPILMVETGHGSDRRQSNHAEVPMGSLTIWLRSPILWLRRPNVFAMKI